MAESDAELDFATVAIAHKLLTHEQVEMAQEQLRKEAASGKPPRTLEEVLLRNGVLKEREIWAIRKAAQRFTRDAKARRQRIGGYEILGTLGEGGLGVVYKARQLSMGRVVALKVLHEKWVGDDEFRKRFLVEARLVGRLSHQNLIHVFDVGRYKNTLYYSMEFVDGETAEDRVDRDGALDPSDALEIVFQVARALNYLKEMEIVHRDVKPGNIMVTHLGVAKLGDFGFVKSSLDSILSPDGEVLGTPDYISPEAARGEKDLDFRSDLYSLGASFYHMLTGKPPFGGTGSAVMEAHIRKEPPPPRTLVAGVPERAEMIVLKLMAKDREARYADFTELFDDLELLRLDLRPSAGGSATGSKSSLLRALERGQGQVDDLLRREAELLRRIEVLRWALIGTALGCAAALTAAAYLFWTR